MCCSYGHSTIESKLFFNLSSQPPPAPPPKISFHPHSPSHRSIRFRIGSRPSYPPSCKSMLKESIFELEGCCFYEELGIPDTGTLIEIKQAYKQLARKYHPDVSPPDRIGENTQRFIRVQQAYEILSDPNRRALYDRNRAKGLHLSFGGRRRYPNYEEKMEDKGEWKSRWVSQVSELKRRSMHKDSDDSTMMSWGARMRKRSNESTSDIT